MSEGFWTKWRVAAVVVLLAISWASTPPTGINYALGSVFGAVVMVWLVVKIAGYVKRALPDSDAAAES